MCTTVHQACSAVAATSIGMRCSGIGHPAPSTQRHPGRHVAVWTVLLLLLLPTVAFLAGTQMQVLELTKLALHLLEHLVE